MAKRKYPKLQLFRKWPSASPEAHHLRRLHEKDCRRKQAFEADMPVGVPGAWREFLRYIELGNHEQAFMAAFGAGQAAGGREWYEKQMPLVQGYYRLKAVDIKKTKAMHDGKKQFDFPDETKRKAVAMFNELLDENPKMKKASITDRVCKMFGMSSRTLDGWRNSFASR